MPRFLMPALLSLSLLSGCATQATLDNLQLAQNNCAAGNATACNAVPAWEHAATKERTENAAKAILFPILIVGFVALAAAAAQPEPTYVVLAPCRRRWAC
jgi:hypothetical protein